MKKIWIIIPIILVAGIFWFFIVSPGFQRSVQPTPSPEIPPQESIKEPEVPQKPQEPEVSDQQEINLEQSVYPGFFSPDPLIVKKGIPVKLSVTTKHREHINRISIQPWVSRSDTLSPGKITVINFTPDQIGEFKIRNIGHGFEGILQVVE